MSSGPRLVVRSEAEAGSELHVEHSPEAGGRMFAALESGWGSWRSEVADIMTTSLSALRIMGGHIGRGVIASVGFDTSLGAVSLDSSDSAELLARRPQDALWFIRMVMVVGTLANVLTSFLSVSYCWTCWALKHDSDRKLWLWVMLNGITQLTQIPLRWAVLSKCRSPRANNEEQLAHVHGSTARLRAITKSIVWKLSLVVSAFGYFLSAFGVVILLVGDLSEMCYVSVMAAISLTMCRLFVSLALVYAAFFADDHSRPRGGGGTDGECQKFLHTQSLKYDARVSGGSYMDNRCSICLFPWEEDEDLLRLPCQHIFHTTCIDKWINRRRKCPLCWRPLTPRPPSWLSILSGPFWLVKGRSCPTHQA